MGGINLICIMNGGVLEILPCLADRTALKPQQEQKIKKVDSMMSKRVQNLIPDLNWEIKFS